MANLKVRTLPGSAATQTEREIVATLNALVRAVHSGTDLAAIKTAIAVGGTQQLNVIAFTPDTAPIFRGEDSEEA